MKRLICTNERRRENVRQHSCLNGLDFVEVSADQLILSVHFLGKAEVDLDVTQVRIEGGQRIRDIQVLDIEVNRRESIEFDDTMEVTVDKPGDFSTYVLRVVEKNEQNEWLPHSQFDPRYDRIEFSFKVDCPNELDCKQEAVCPPEKADEPDINYLAKDYSSFRQLLLDRLALVMPDWQERHIPDVGIALVEVFAYVGDYLSYYQDAVATEAYLDTARQRISVRRHARLVDYNMHEGCNARAWVCVETSSDRTFDPTEIYFITAFQELPKTDNQLLSEQDLKPFPSSLYEVFEPMGKGAIRIYSSHNIIRFYTWGDQECCLPRGSIGATLVGELVQHSQPKKTPSSSCPAPESQDDSFSSIDYSQARGPDQSVPRLHLKPGDVLIFEEVIGPKSGHPGDANPKHRHVVRLTKVEASLDRLNNVAVVEISWAEEDALPFPLCLSALGPPPECKIIEDVSIACGNTILVDHGETKEEELGCVPLKASIDCCKGEGLLGDRILESAPYYPSLESTSLTFSQPLAPDKPASTTLYQDVRRTLPRIGLISTSCSADKEEALLSWAEIDNPEILAKRLKTDSGLNSQVLLRRLSSKSRDLLAKYDVSKSLTTELEHALLELIDDLTSDWEPQQGLLSSGPDDRHFVVEIDDTRRAHLRFGDDEVGEMPDAGTAFHAIYRIGNGPAGNVGAEAISYLVMRHTQLSGVDLKVRNPLPAQGGTAAEPVEEVKLFAPHAFRKELQRAITADDYAAIVQREFKDQVQRAAAQLRWTGSWYEMLVAVDLFGQEEADQALLDAVAKRLHRYRRIGHDLVVRSARRIPLDIVLLVCVLPNYLRGHVKAALFEVFSNKRLTNGRRGFFHPDNLTFGEGIHLSKLVAVAQAIEGVESVQVTKLQRLNAPPNQEIEKGILPLGPFEIARLDNNPSFPENGILKLDMRGGR